MAQAFTYTSQPNPHSRRSREIIKKYPEVRKLIGPYPLSAVYIILINILMLSLAFWLEGQSWWMILLLAYTVGAIANHSLFAMIHEACHNLVFKSNWGNKLIGILCNVPQAFPSAIGFRTYHLIHHSNLNEYEYDADLAFEWEAKWVSNIWWRKILWFVGFMVIEAIRPMKLIAGSIKDKWVVFNVAFIILTDFFVVYYFGWKALSFLFLSSFFSVGLHPVGARWIQEHYTFKEGQETYSYYGPMNFLAFNIGYHNEHHDLFRVPWVHLPKLKAMAPEYYNNLYSHHSWAKLFFRFIFDKKLSLYSRIVRQQDMDPKTNNDIKNIDPFSGITKWNTEKSENQVYS